MAKTVMARTKLMLERILIRIIIIPLQASESRSMRGMKRLASEAASRFEQQQKAGGDDTAHGSPGARGAVTRNGV